MRSATLGPTPGVRDIAALSRIAMAEASSRRLERAEHGERDLGADALHGLQQPEPFALDVGGEAEQLDLVLAHMGLDRQRRRLARRAAAPAACAPSNAPDSRRRRRRGSTKSSP